MSKAIRQVTSNALPMTTYLARLARSALHPFLFAAYAVIALLAANAGQMQAGVGIRSLLIALAGTAVVYLVLRLALRDGHRAGLAASGIVLLLVSYGHAYDALKDAVPILAPFIRHRYLLPLTMVALLGLTILAIRLRSPERLAPILNSVALVALAFPIVHLIQAEVADQRARSALADAASECTLRPEPGAPRPDVYLFIMDAYERDDVLQEMHGYDNRPFLRALEERGFYVARGSLSNYRNTEQSLASLLNMDYLQSLEDVYAEGEISSWGMIQRISNNRLRRELECLGYETVAFETGAFWTEWEGTDHFFVRNAGPFADLGLLGGVSRFEAKLLDTTVVRAALDGVRQSQAAGRASSIDPLADHRDRILFVFDQVGQVPALPSPKLVFVHIISPHPPMVFKANGEFISLGEFETTIDSDASGQKLLAAYGDQVTYLNSRLLETVDEILAGSQTPPIIIIQGDHGWADRNHEDKVSILNAYHLPGAAAERLYPTITPVNSFRIVLQEYFGGPYDLLEDVTYWSDEIDTFDFEVVPNTWQP